MTEEKLLELLKSMSLKEKVYQMVQPPGVLYDPEAAIAGNPVCGDMTEEEIALAGTTLYVYGAEKANAMQKAYIEKHPHGIPTMFMMDVIHGFRTIFPIPLAQGASFDADLAESLAALAAKEASAAGVHIDFSPMADLVRDARWGRVMESSGEDPYVNGLMAAAAVKGYHTKIGACLKHYAGYGASEAGRDYNVAELSDHTLREFYLPAYKAAVDAGVDMVMTSFNLLNGTTTVGSSYLIKDILRGEWGFEGVVITDWNAVEELVAHGLAKDLKEAALIAVNSGVDIDMTSPAFAHYLTDLVLEGKVSEERIDESVLRILKLKNKYGLFENPYVDPELEKTQILTAENRALAREAVAKTCVLLKNTDAVLPIKKEQKIAFVGPFAESNEMISAWAPIGHTEDVVTIKAAADELASDGWKFAFAKGVDLTTRHDMGDFAWEGSIKELRKGIAQKLHTSVDASETEKAVETAKAADTAVVCIGEHPNMSGEGASRGSISLPEDQLELLRQVSAVNPNTAAVIFTGRPLDLREICTLAKSILIVWLPGVEGGHGIMDVLTGAYNPAGKLTMSFPYCLGQLPICYQQFHTGRLKNPDEHGGMYTSAYMDQPNGPLFPFGYGLSYTEFSYSPVTLSGNTASVTVENIGKCAGEEVVQLYIRDLVASLARPMKELKGFEKICLKPGEKKIVSFEITEEMLAYAGPDGKRIAEPGDFMIYIGTDSETENGALYTLA